MSHNDPAISVENVRPPYRSPWIDVLPPITELVADLGGRRTSLVESLIGGGDFDRYEVGTNSWNFPWWNLRLDGTESPAEPVIDAATQARHTALTNRNDTRRYRDAMELIVRTPHIRLQIERKLRPARSRGHSFLAHLAGARRNFEEAERALRATADAVDNDDPALAGWPLARGDEHAFPISVVRQRLLHAVLELGWSESRFADVDRRLARRSLGDRSRPRVERIGKKYQWIALHRVLAQIADRFCYHRGLNDRDDDGEYHGPWQLPQRDIDPTSRLTRTEGQQYGHHACWWSPVRGGIALKRFKAGIWGRG